MKKALLAPAATLVLLFSLSLLNGAAIQKEAARWSSQLQQAVHFIQSENWNAIETAIQTSYEDWRVKQTYLHIVLEHEAIDNAEAMYQRAFAFTSAKDSQELQAELADLLHQLTLLSEMERLSIKNIL